MKKNKPENYLNHFVGGVPAGVIFFLNLKDIKTILSEHDWDKSRIELCYIGLTAYFGAFFKDHFASLININANLIYNLKKSGMDVTIDFIDILKYEIDLTGFYGFLFAEKFDFGTAKKINHLYNSLINIAPFSKADIDTFDYALNNRNLIVHHGGIYTTKYSNQVFTKRKIKERVFYDSLIISREMMFDYISFSEQIVYKTMNASQKRITEIFKLEKKRITKHLKSLIEDLGSAI